MTDSTEANKIKNTSQQSSHNDDQTTEVSQANQEEDGTAPETEPIEGGAVDEAENETAPETENTQENQDHENESVQSDESDWTSSKVFGRRNIILYGPPGTGKTYQLMARAVYCATHWEQTEDEFRDFEKNNRSEIMTKYRELITDQRIKFVTFHSNYSYEDFIEGFKFSSEESKIVLKSGLLKELLPEQTSIPNLKSLTEINYDEAKKELWAHIKDKQEVRINNSYSIYILKTSFKAKLSTGNSITLSAPALKGFYEDGKYRTHQSTYYIPTVRYMKKLSRHKNLDKLFKESPNRVLIIDEINRANISRVFGELITLIEEDKRLGEENEVKVTLPYSGDEFGLPPNLYIIGAMNTADKSIALLDIALRRRFKFIPVYPDSNLIKEEWRSFFRALNEEMVLQKGKNGHDFQVGHAYFMKDLSLPDILNYEVIPLLMEYFLNNGERVKEIIINAQSKSDLSFKIEVNSVTGIPQVE